ESEDGPHKLRCRVAEPGAAARNPYPVDATEMQVGEPIKNLIADARPLIGVGGRFESIGEVLKQLRVAQIGPADREQQDECEGPEAEHAVQVPGEALPSGVPVNSQASSPRPDPRPPH